MARHLVEKARPELHVPHFRDVALGGGGVVRVAGRPGVERNVELDAAPGDARGNFQVGDLFDPLADAHPLGQFQERVHRPRFVRPGNADHRRQLRPDDAPDGEALRCEGR
jgi:hypothetical protein